MRMIVPAGRVVSCDRKLMSFGTLKMRSLFSFLASVESIEGLERRAHVNGQSWRTWAFFKPRILNWLASGNCAAETMTGPGPFS